MTFNSTVNTGKEYRIIIVEDNAEFAKGLKLLIDTWPQFKVIDVVHDGTEIVEHSMLWLTDIILMDVNMPRLNGIMAGKQVNFHFPDIKLVAITLNKEEVFLEEFVAAGFKGFVDKQLIVEELIHVLQKVLSNKYAIPKSIFANKKS